MASMVVIVALVASFVLELKQVSGGRDGTAFCVTFIGEGTAMFTYWSRSGRSCHLDRCQNGFRGIYIVGGTPFSDTFIGGATAFCLTYIGGGASLCDTCIGGGTPFLLFVARRPCVPLMLVTDRLVVARTLVW